MPNSGARTNPTTGENPLGSYLKGRRARLDPAAFGFTATRRRTPGLRREEVAQRANVSATWYTWLEQGRGGTPSTDVLDRIAAALELSAVEREHLFLLAQHRPPKIRYQAPSPVPPQLQHVLDSLELSPALVKTNAWDVVAWNKAATVVLTDYAALPLEDRNVLRLIFCNPTVRGHMTHWEDDARFAVAAFRAESARAGASERAAELVEELSSESADFARIWRDHDVRSYGAGIKHFTHAIAGPLALEYSAFAVDGRPDLGLVIYTPTSQEDRDSIRALLNRCAQP